MKEPLTEKGSITLQPEFFLRTDPLLIAKEMLGKLLCTCFEDKLTIARIVETEAYHGIGDRASHAFGNRNTRRTSVMYAAGGTAYVYLCYGIHHLFNVVTNAAGTPHAVLVRAAEPVTGISTMLERTGKFHADFTLTKGPGNVSRALGISTAHSGFGLFEPPIWLAEDGYAPGNDNTVATKRIGVDYAGEDALLPYRFILKNNPYVSGNRKANSK